jgi:hypothetical protein
MSLQCGKDFDWYGTTKETVDRYEIPSVNKALYYVKGKIRDSRPVAQVILRD